MLFLYLHGFNSSPNSIKACKIHNFLLEHYPNSEIVMPQLSICPNVASALINDILNKEYACKFIIGSSLGGLFARYLTETRDDISGAILINPALRIDKLIKVISKEQYSPYLNKNYTLTDTHFDFVNKLMCHDTIDERKYLLLCQKDDQECCWKESRDILPNVQFYLGTGQGHSFEYIDIAFDAIKKFISSRTI